ncbi:hypothetical protein [Pedobacter sp. MR2016-24]|uniref:hypothetical protein n=1 Tax=Pedobacter sp. MR2016-24 TaxID=2994466 RepID=UPI00224567D3|nr:hypothetical protein [Pedobacter sp. MR2016-24]MCX2484521.1 hypothetical protein [Pedobacter sp. MR2016-24]
MSKYKPRSCFFTAPASIGQNDAQAFGPVASPSASNKFRLTSKFTSAGAKAFAVCKGVVLIQPQTGSNDTVNLIIRPYIQPISGLNIKYFIYRGITKSSFFDGEKVLAATSSTSDFINKINANFTAFHTKTNPQEEVPDFMAKYIGFDPANQPDNLKLDDFFFKQSDYVESAGEFIEAQGTAFELPLIDMGATIGDFKVGECGIDIVLSYGDYALPDGSDEFVFDLAYGRAKESLIDISGISDAFQQKRKREQIFQFLDAAAYYGFHSIEGGIVHTYSGGVMVDKKGNDIYNDVVSKFFTRNNVYLYIQSDRTRSYNFYGNYAITEGSPESLKFGLTEEGLAERVYGTDGWPLIIEKNPQVSSDGRNKMFVQFVTDNNVNTMLYGQVAQIDNAQHNNFCGPDDLKLPVDLDAEETTDPGYTKIIMLSNPATGTESNKLNVATFNILLYQGKTYNYTLEQIVDEEGQITSTYGQPNFFDDVFNLITGIPLLKNITDSEYSLLASQKIRLVNHVYNGMQHGITAVQTNIVKDVIDTGTEEIPTLKRVTYITQPIDIFTLAGSFTASISNDITSSSSASVASNSVKTYDLPKPLYYDVLNFTDSARTITGIQLKEANNINPNRTILGLTEVENDLLKKAIQVNQVINAMLILVSFYKEGNESLSSEIILYQKYKAGIVGENNDGYLEIYMPENEIILYSIDQKYLFTDDYSKFMVKETIDSILDSDIYL